MPRRKKPKKIPPPLVGERLEVALDELAPLRIRYTREEVAAQTRRVEELLFQGATERQIHRLLTTPNPATPGRPPEFPNLSLRKVKQRVVEVSKLWQSEERDGRDGIRMKRFATIRRLHEIRRQALAGERGANGVFVREPDLALALRVEQQIIRLEGTAAPQEIEVTNKVSSTMINVISNLDDETAKAMLEEAMEEEALAGAARRLLPGVSGVIDVEGAPVPATPEESDDADYDEPD